MSPSVPLFQCSEPFRRLYEGMEKTKKKKQGFLKKSRMDIHTKSQRLWQRVQLLHVSESDDVQAPTGEVETNP